MAKNVDYLYYIYDPISDEFDNCSDDMDGAIENAVQFLKDDDTSEYVVIYKAVKIVRLPKPLVEDIS